MAVLEISKRQCCYASSQLLELGISCIHNVLVNRGPDHELK